MDDKKRLIQKEDITSLKKKHEKLKNSKYRDYFHIDPLTGLLNDPNGLFYKDGTYHIYYQWYPFKGVHGLKHWYEVKSPDLVNFKNEGLAIRPDKKYKNRGAYSGSAFIEDGEVYFSYSGNEKDENEKRYPNEVLARLEDGEIVDKSVIISRNPDYKEDQRDPRIFKIDGIYYLLLGARDKEDRAQILLYRSKYIDKDWEFYGKLDIKNLDINPYMFECPDLIKIDDDYVLLFSPQGLEKRGEYFNNIYNNGYIIGDLDIYEKTFSPRTDFIELDRGFDFYAAQSFVGIDKNYLIGWLGLPDTLYPNDKNFSGSLSLAREIYIKDDRLFTRPVKEIEKLREKEIEFSNIVYDIDPMEIEIEDIEKDFEIGIYSNKDKGGFKITYKDNKFVIDRSNLLNIISKDYGLERTISNIRINKLSIYIDKSSVEIFINDGEYAQSLKIFPKDKERDLYIKNLEKHQVFLYKLKKSYEDNFII